MWLGHVFCSLNVNRIYIITFFIQNAMDSATCVALHHGLDDMVAVGYVSGALYIFQLPSNLLGHSKKVSNIFIQYELS